MVFPALAGMAGTALVQAVVTDGWEDVRHRVARLFGRGRPDPKTEQRLDATRAQLAGLDGAALQEAQAALAAQWHTRFGDLLADNPDAEVELTALVREIRSPAVASDHGVAASRDVHVKADRGGVAAAVIHGDVTTGPTGPGGANR